MPQNESFSCEHAPVICTACPLRWRSAASDPDLILRSLRIRILSGCVGGFSMPQNGSFSCEHAPTYPPAMCFLLLFPC